MKSQGSTTIDLKRKRALLINIIKLSNELWNYQDKKEQSLELLREGISILDYLIAHQFIERAKDLYIKKQKQFKVRLSKRQQEKEIIKLENGIKGIKDETQKPQTDKKEELFKNIIDQKVNYMFSQQHKQERIKITNNNLTATNPENWDAEHHSPIALVDGIVLQKGSSINFLIQRKAYNVHVGLGLRNLIASYNYQLKNHGKKTGHGCFMLGHAGWLNHHNDRDYNYITTGNGFSEGQVVKLETTDHGLLFTSEYLSIKINVTLKEEEWQQACFCVQLDGEGDSVSILNDQEELHLYEIVKKAQKDLKHLQASKQLQNKESVHERLIRTGKRPKSK